MGGQRGSYGEADSQAIFYVYAFLVCKKPMAALLIVTVFVAAFLAIPFVASRYDRDIQVVQEQIWKAPIPESLELHYDKVWLVPMSVLLSTPFLGFVVGHGAILLHSDTQLYQLFLAPLTFLASLVALPFFKALANINHARITLSADGVAFLDQRVGTADKVSWTDVLEIQTPSFQSNIWLRIKFTRDGQECQVDIGESFTKHTFEFNCWTDRFWKAYRNPS